MVDVYEFSHLCDADAIVEASVGSVLQVVTASLRSPQAGCVAPGTPEVEIVLIHRCETAASDSTPPRDDAPGFGNCAADALPLKLLNATWEQLAFPLAAIPVAQLFPEHCEGADASAVAV